ncbi:MAG: hypothetical protein H5T69_07385 [Chloroflexi bacterium]|nr:hypothetical protein [Chloroflexota bacterium]
MGIIDTLSSGFRAVSRRLWLMTIPVLLDLYLWLGPKLSIRPAIERTVELFRAIIETTPGTAGAGTDSAAMAELMLETLRDTVGRLNLFALLAWGRLGVPSVGGIGMIPDDAKWVVEISEYWQVLLLQLVILAVGLLVACLYLGSLANYVRGGNLRLLLLLRRVPIYWLHMAVIFVPLSILLIFALSIAMLLGPLSVFIGVGILWLMLFLSFVPQAVTLAEHNPLLALWSSFAIVRLNFWPTIGIVVLTNLISTGLGLIWNQVLLGSPIGTLVAILANAYVGTGLTLALFIFYRDRVLMLRQRLEQQRSV